MLLLKQKIRTAGWGISLVVFFIMLTGCGWKENAVQTVMKSVEDAQVVASLNNMAEQMYESIMQGDEGRGKQELERLAASLQETGIVGFASSHAAQALQEAMDEGQTLFASSGKTAEDKERTAAKIRLAMDAIAHPKQPLWLQYDRLIRDDNHKLWAAALSESPEAMIAAFNDLLRHIARVRPALLLSKDAGAVGRLDNEIMAMRNELSRSDISGKRVQERLVTLQRTIDSLWNQGEESTFLPVADPQKPIIWTLGIGSAIVLTLFYAAYRMYGLRKQAISIPGRRKP